MGKTQMKVIALVVTVQTLFAVYGSYLAHTSGISWPLGILVMVPVGFFLGAAISVFSFPDEAARVKEAQTASAEEEPQNGEDFEPGVPTGGELQLALDVAQEIEFGAGHKAAALRIADYREWLLGDDDKALSPVAQSVTSL